ncbi:hypothetical protein J4429_01560 [Candidatus Pacearchaeota archaeon]|nr:hypothetical protein [Candidatus Pacearchaeota archaeon]
MEIYYGSNEKGAVVIYASYYFAGMSLNGISFRFRFDFPFLDRLAKSRLNFEDLAKKGWDIQKVDVGYHYLDFLLNSIYSKSEERINNDLDGIVELADGFCRQNIRNLEYDDGYSEMDTEEECREDKWWDFGLPPPFLSENINWTQEDYED